MRLILLIALLAAAPPSRTFTDPVGDANGAPDVTAVDIAADAATATFTVRTADAASWTNAAAIFDLNGFSYVLHSLHDQFTLDRPDGTHTASPAASAALAGATLTITVPLAEIGNPATVAFHLSTPSSRGEDEASGSFSPAATVSGLAATFTPRAPVHGKAFAVARVRTLFSDGTTGSAPCTGTCRWKVPSGRTFRVTVHAAGRARVYSFRVR
jgi:hypothetical protein